MKIGLEFAQPARGLHLHGLLRKPKPGSDVFLGDAVQATKDKDLTAARRQRVNRLNEKIEVLSGGGGLAGIGSLI